MSTPSEFAALLRADPESGFSPPKQSKKLIMPPQSLAPIPRHEQTPLLPPVSPRNNLNKFADAVRPLPPAPLRILHGRAALRWQIRLIHFRRVGHSATSQGRKEGDAPSHQIRHALSPSLGRYNKERFVEESPRSKMGRD